MNIKQQLFQEQLKYSPRLTKDDIELMVSDCDTTFWNDWVPGDIQLIYLYTEVSGEQLIFDLNTLRYSDLDDFLEKYEVLPEEFFGSEDYFPRFCKKGEMNAIRRELERRVQASNRNIETTDRETNPETTPES